MYVFTVCLAGIPVEIRCRYEENRIFLKDYLTDRDPLLTIEPSADDLEQIQEGLNRMDEAEKFPKRRRPESFLENNAIHALLAEKLVEHNVLLMHGSALCMDGKAYIFTAASGTGKSTHARLWREVFGDRVWMINDDKPMLRIEESGVTVWGTPWDGKHRLSRNASARLHAIIRLVRSKENRMTSMSKAEAFPVVMAQTFASDHPAAMMHIVQLETQLLDAVDFYTLECNMNPEAAETAWETLKGPSLPPGSGYSSEPA